MRHHRVRITLYAETWQTNSCVTALPATREHFVKLVNLAFRIFFFFFFLECFLHSYGGIKLIEFNRQTNWVAVNVKFMCTLHITLKQY